MLELAGALNDAGEPVALNQARMERIAAAYDVTDARVAVLPNMVLAAGGRGAPTALDFDAPATRRPTASTGRPRSTALARDAERAAIDPEDGLRRLDEIAAMRHRFGTLGVIGGHMVLTHRARADPAADAGGAGRRRRLRRADRRAEDLRARPADAIGVLLPVAAATLVSALAFWIAPDKTIDGSMRILIPALVTFIPGSLLTTATLDLSAGEVISGSSRLVAGTMQLILLSFGIAVGALSRRRLARRGDHQRGQEHARRLGAVARRDRVRRRRVRALLRAARARSAGCSSCCSPPGSASRSAAASVSDTLGAFFGALVATPVAAWVATRPSGPPPLATFLPAFWLLVPGAVGLIGMAEFVGSNRAAGLDHFVNAIDHVHVDRDRRAGRQRARPALYVELIPPSTGRVMPVT